MKLLVILAAVALLLWLVRGGRRKPAAPQARKPAAPAAPAIAAPEAMVECGWCGLHLPASDALPALRGPQPGERHYCCADHRRRAGG